MITNMSQRVNGVAIEYPDGAKGMMMLFRDQLLSYRGKSPKPEELEWEIRVYDYMLKQPDPEATLKAYQDARMTKNGFIIHKKKAIKNLGWKIP